MGRLIFILLGLLPSLCHAQGEDNFWAFGEGLGIDFSSGIPVAVSTSITPAHEGVASISNSSGQLMFYTNGSRVWDRNHMLMPNGLDLCADAAYQYPTRSTTQGAVIIPIPDSAGKYYIFSLTSSTGGATNPGRLYYCVVDMSLHGGFGDVEAGRKSVLADTALSEKMTAVQGDRCNIWLLVHTLQAPVFKAYEITSSGFNTTPVLSTAGLPGVVPLWNAGGMKVSPNRKRLAACPRLQLFDFDPYSGIVSNPVTLDQTDSYYGVSFSPDNSKLYASANGGNGSIYQFDLASSPAVQTLLGDGFSDLRLAPDGKIYFSPLIGGTWLGTIDFPDLSGTSCHFTSNALQFTSPSSEPISVGLPNTVVIFKRDTIHSTKDVQACFRDSIRIAASDTTGQEYLWTTGVSDISIGVTGPGVYAVNYLTSPCVYHQDTFRVAFAVPPTAGSFAGCSGQSNGYLWIAPGGGDTSTYTYTWKSPQGQTVRVRVSNAGDTLFTNTTGQYSVTMDGANGCNTTMYVRYEPPAYKSSFTADSIICMGDTLLFNNTSAGFSNYTWYFGDGDSSKVVNPQHHYPDPGVYRVLLIGYPCADTARFNLTVDSTSYISFAADSNHHCEGLAFYFNASYPSGLTSLLWDFGDNTVLFSSGYPAHAYDSGGSYKVTAQASFRACPEVSHTDSVYVYPHPNVDLGPDTSLCTGGSAIILTSLSARQSGETFLWCTGDTSAFSTVRHSGIYWLTVTSEHDCSTTDSMEVFKSCYLDIPNAFTPNEDGINDYFFPRQQLSRSLTKFNLQVFNRWGQVIFATDNINGRGWDGRYNDVAQPQDVYIYLIEAEIDGRRTEYYKGNLTLIR